MPKGKIDRKYVLKLNTYYDINARYIIETNLKLKLEKSSLTIKGIVGDMAIEF